MSATAAAVTAAAATAAATGATAASGLAYILYAIILLAIGAALLLVEFFVLSAGLLTVGAVACGGSAVFLAFQHSAGAGWVIALATPVVGVAVVIYGLRSLGNSAAVPRTEITAEAGQQSIADRVGAGIGSQGELVTDAYPTGRARFAAGEIDVLVKGPVLSRGATVRVVAIEGPVVLVVKA